MHYFTFSKVGQWARLKSLLGLMFHSHALKGLGSMWLSIRYGIKSYLHLRVCVSSISSIVPHTHLCSPLWLVYKSRRFPAGNSNNDTVCTAEPISATAQLLTYRAGDAHTTHGCTNIHFEATRKENWKKRQEVTNLSLTCVPIVVLVNLCVRERKLVHAIYIHDWKCQGFFLRDFPSAVKEKGFF